MQEMAQQAVHNNGVEIVAKVIAAEAASQGRQGMLGVAHVIANRSKNANKDPMAIVAAPNQFYGYTAKNRDKIYEGVKAEALKIAQDLYDGKLGEDFTKGATFFRQPNEPVMKWHGEETFKLGNHIFHRERKKQ